MKKKYILIESILLVIVLKTTARFGTSLYIASLPAMAVSLGISSNTICFSMVLYLIGAIISYIAAGILSTKYDIVTLLIGGIAIFIFSSFLISFNYSITVIMLGRLLQGVGIGFAPAFGNVLISETIPDINPNKNRILSILLAFLSLIIAWSLPIAMITGGYLQQHYGWRSNFDFLTITGIVLIILLLFFNLSSSPMQHNKKTIIFPLKSYLCFIKNSEYMIMVLPFAISSSGITAFYLASSFIFVNTFQLPPSYIGYLSLFQVEGFLIGKLLSIFYFNIKLNVIILISLCICLLSSLIMNFAIFNSQIDLIIAITAIAGYSFALGLLMPYISTKIMSFNPKRDIVASSLFMLLVLTTMAVSSFIVSLFHFRNIKSLGIFLTILTLLSLFAMQFYNKKKMKA